MDLCHIIFCLVRTYVLVRHDAYLLYGNMMFKPTQMLLSGADPS